MDTEKNKPEEKSNKETDTSVKGMARPLENCAKPQSAESSRFFEDDEACDDGVK